MGDQPMADVPEELFLFAPRVAPVDHVQRRLLDAGRVLVTGGWLVLTYTTISNDRAVNAEHAILGFALLLLGVSMITLSPVANRFPGTAGALAAAVADAVLFYFFAPAN